MPKCTIENWKMKEIAKALTDMECNGKKILIPRFQRGKRWIEPKENDFIDSIIKGYPVGTLLFYKTKDTYILVDGLQRSTAISRYIKNPMKYFDINNIPEEILCKIYNVLGFEGQEIIIKDKVKHIIFDYIKSLPSYEGENSYNLSVIISNEISTIKEKTAVVGELMEILPNYLKICKSNYEIISDTEIPAVVYTGSEDELPEIFTRINSKGTPLTTYEIYAASWPQTEKIEITNPAILENVIKKYETLENDDQTIRGFERNEISIKKQLTIFEYAFGLSKWLNQEYAILAFEKKDKADEISTIGFELLDACLFDSKDIGSLCTELKKYNINKLEKRIVEAINFIEKIIAPITKFKGNSRKEDHLILYAKNQIVSMIAFAFREKYDVNNLNQEKEDWKYKEDNLKKHLFDYFVYDILQKEWFEGGGKLHTAINSKKYLEDISPSAWESALNNMFEESLNKKATKAVRNPLNIDIVFLNAIYMTKFSALDQLSPDKFDIEHIATKDLMKNLIMNTCPDDSLEGLPIGSVANLCYLPEYQNRSKGNKTFYQDNNYLHGLSLSEIENKFSFTEKGDLEWTGMNYEKGDFGDLKEMYIGFLKKRFFKQKSKFYQSMNIDINMINEEADQNKYKDQVTKKLSNSVVESHASKIKQSFYDSIRKKLEKKYNAELSFETKTIVVGSDKRFIMTYSKLYMQGIRHKYWFAYSPYRISEGADFSQFYVFACKEDQLSFAIPIEYIEQNKLCMSKTGMDDKVYFHIVIFIDTDDLGKKKMSLLLSKPEIKEKNISEFLI